MSRALAVHMSLGAEQSGEQTRDTEIDIEPLPVQAKSQSENFHLRQIFIARSLESLRLACRKSEAAAIR